MRVSKFVKAHKDILLEYIYNDGNNIGDPYKILVNIRDNSYSYQAGDSSTTGNTTTNQLFRLDGVSNTYGLVNTTNYSFLSLREYPSGFPTRHDTLKIHLPVNYTFGEYLGCYVRIYAFDYNNEKTYDVSNFFFDATDVNQSYLLGYNSPPLLFQEKLWGKNLTLEVPAVFALANQRVNNATKQNTINFNLTNGAGIGLNTPIFIDFHFITSKKTVNSVTTYTLTSKTPISLPQTPDFENLGVKIEHSVNGDFFEIYGVYNGNIAEFNNFINNSVQLGNRYYVTYTVTLYEQNIRGKTFTITVTDNFNEKVEYRPIIKYSTTTAIIDVEMNVIDAVDNSSIYRRASYGMLQDEVAKYSINLTKINLQNASKPKVYNIKTAEGAGIFGNSGQIGISSLGGGKPQIVLDPVKINYAVLVDKFNVVAKSENVLIGKTNFYGIGKLQLMFQPFDNILALNIARNVESDQKTVDVGNGSKTEPVTKPEYMDMTNMGEIKMVIKNQQLSVDTGLYMASNQVDLSKGQVVFKIPASKMNDVRKIYDSGVNVFYITATQDSGQTVVYSGLFTIYDSKDNILNMNNTLAQIQAGLFSANQQPSIIPDPDNQKSGTAIVTRKIVSNPGVASGTASASSNSTTSSPSSTKIGTTTYAIDSGSNLVIDGYSWTPTQLKGALNLSSEPTRLSFKTDAVYSNDKYLDKLSTLKTKLESKYLVTKEIKDLKSRIENNFKNK
jgi:hypothetical protein